MKGDYGRSVSYSIHLCYPSRLAFYYLGFFLSFVMAFRHLKLGDRNRVISDFYLSHLDEEKRFTVEHFVNNHGMKRATVYRAIERADQISLGGQDKVDRRPGSGRPRALSQRQERSVLRAVENKKGGSTKRQAQQRGVTQRTVQRIIHRQGGKSYKRQKAPQIDAEQMEKVKERATKLSRNFFPPGVRTAIIVDDESYLKR